MRFQAAVVLWSGGPPTLTVAAAREHGVLEVGHSVLERGAKTVSARLLNYVSSSFLHLRWSGSNPDFQRISLFISVLSWKFCPSGSLQAVH